jgi:hypothetical protein
MSGKIRARTLVVQRILAAAVLALFLPLMAHANSDTITIINNDGMGGTSGPNNIFTLTGSTVDAIGMYSQVTGMTMSFTTGAFTGSLSGSAYGATAGTWAAGPANSFIVNGYWNGYSGQIFVGQFSGTVSWILNGCTGSGVHTSCTYDLTGPVSGTWINGTKVYGETTQLLFTFTGAPVACGTGHCGNFTGGSITDTAGATTLVTPEPNSLGMMGAGLLAMGFVVKRKIRGT